MRGADCEGGGVSEQYRYMFCVPEVTCDRSTVDTSIAAQRVFERA